MTTLQFDCSQNVEQSRDPHVLFSSFPLFTVNLFLLSWFVANLQKGLRIPEYGSHDPGIGRQTSTIGPHHLPPENGQQEKKMSTLYNFTSVVSLVSLSGNQYSVALLKNSKGECVHAYMHCHLLLYPVWPLASLSNPIAALPCCFSKCCHPTRLLNPSRLVATGSCKAFACWCCGSLPGESICTSTGHWEGRWRGGDKTQTTALCLPKGTLLEGSPPFLSFPSHEYGQGCCCSLPLSSLCLTQGLNPPFLPEWRLSV